MPGGQPAKCPFSPAAAGESSSRLLALREPIVEHATIVQKFCEFVRIDSPAKYEGDFAEAVRRELAELGIEASYDGAGARLGGECDNLIGRLPANNEGSPSLLLNAHLDTVGPSAGIEPVIEDDTIRSAGETILGADCKAGVAIILAALQRLQEQGAPHGEIAIVFTVAEEIGLHGARHLDYRALEPLPDMAYVLDGGHQPGKLTTAAPYADEIACTIRGRAAHAGVEPEKGINAIQVASRALAQMRLGRLDEETTANVGTIQGGVAHNIVPAVVEFVAEARSHDEEKLREQTQHMCEVTRQAAAAHAARAEIRQSRTYNGFALGPDDPVVARAVQAARQVGLEPVLGKGGGGSDANIFNEYGIPSVIVATGAGSPHTLEESLHVPSLLRCLDWVTAMLTTG